MKYKAVLFDMDGVIIDSEPLHVAAFKDVLIEKGHTLTDEGYKTHFAGKTDKAGFLSYFDSGISDSDIATLMNEKARVYEAIAQTKLVAYPGIAELIREVSRTAMTALVTGSLRTEAAMAVDALGLHDCLSVIVAAEDVTHGKPDPQGYLKAMAELGVSAADCVVVEDSPSGVQAAIAAGADCIAVTNTHTPEELEKATMVVDVLSKNLF